MPVIEKQNRDVISSLRSAIVDGEYQPGQRLKFAELANTYGASYGSLRETLTVLNSEGFVTQEVNKGFAVAPVSKEELWEITEHYIQLENRAICKAIELGDEAWEATIVAAHYRLQAIEKLPWEERVSLHSDWVVRHREFHEKLVEPCRNTWLFRLRSMMFDQLDRYRFVTKMTPTKGKLSRASEHKRIMDAVIARETETACRLLKDHVEQTAARAEKLLLIR